MKKAFTLIELLVVIAIIALLSTLSVVALNSARAKSRDARRLSDIKNTQTALEMYFDTAGEYPATLMAGNELSYGGLVFLAKVPSDPLGSNQYNYVQTESGQSYTLDFTTETKSSNYEAGNYQATPNGILAGGGGGTPPSFVCGDDLIDGGQTYSTIGKSGYCFMTASVNNDKNCRCLYDNPNNCKYYGGLCEFGAGDDLCPSGWRLPKASESHFFGFLIIGQGFKGYYDGKAGYSDNKSYLMLTGSDALDVVSQTVSTLFAGSAVSVRCVKDPS